MRGTELPQWQIDAAEKLVIARRVGENGAPVSYDRQIALPFGDLVRLVAWYGAIRAKAVSEGADPNVPGETYVVRA